MRFFLRSGGEGRDQQSEVGGQDSLIHLGKGKRGRVYSELGVGLRPHVLFRFAILGWVQLAIHAHSI
jgi:hypothetical protein